MLKLQFPCSFLIGPRCFVFPGPQKCPHAQGDAEKSPLLKGLHHGSTKRDGSSPRLGYPRGAVGPQKIRAKCFFSSFFRRERF